MKKIWFYILVMLVIVFNVAEYGDGIFSHMIEKNEIEKQMETLYARVEKNPTQVIKEAEEMLKYIPSESKQYKSIIFNIFGKAALFLGKTNKAKEWAEKALNISKKTGYTEGKILSIITIVNVCVVLNEMDKGIVLAEKGLKQAEENKLDYYIMVLASGIGSCHAKKGEYDIAILYYQNALDYAQKKNNTEYQSKMLNNLSSLLIATKEHKKALIMLEKAIILAEELNNKGVLTILYTNKANVLDTMGRVDEQTEVLNKALLYAREVGSTRNEGAVLSNLADLYLRSKKYIKSAELAKQALDIAKRTGEKSMILVNKVTYAQARSSLGFHNDAIKVLNEALVSFQKLGLKAETIQVTRYLSEANEKAKRPWKALEVYKEFKKKSDAFFQGEKQKIMAELYAKYETGQKEKEIILLSKENQQKHAQRNIIFIIALSVIFIAVLILQRLLTSRKTNTKLRELNGKLNELSLKDTLTGLYNRRYFLAHISSHIAYSRRKNKDLKAMTGKLAFMILDIDHFKKVNDNEGHNAGDLVLVEFGKRILNVFRESDVVVRWGGEEFLIVVRDATMDGIKNLSERILEDINSSGFQIENKALNIACSIGYCCFPFADDRLLNTFSWEKTIQIADNALYKAKSSGRNRAVGVNASLLLKTELEADIVLNNFDEALRQNLINLFVSEG